MASFVEDEKRIPLLLEPLAYLIAYLAARTWVGVGLHVCWARMEVMVERSGRVAFDSQSRDPTRLCMWC